MAGAASNATEATLTSKGHATEATLTSKGTDQTGEATLTSEAILSSEAGSQAKGFSGCTAHIEI